MAWTAVSRAGYPVIRITSAFPDARVRQTRSLPSTVPGMVRSVNTKSQFSWSRPTASSPLDAVETSKPARRSTWLQMSRIPDSSSTTRILAAGFFSAGFIGYLFAGASKTSLTLPAKSVNVNGF